MPRGDRSPELRPMPLDRSTPISEPIKQSELLGKLVINRLTAEEVGRVDQIWVEGKSQQVLGITYRAGLITLKRPMFFWTQVETIGTDSIVITLPTGAVQEKPPESAVTIVGHELWTEDGSKVGVIGDYHLDPETGQITDYLVIRDEWQGMTSGIYRLRPGDVLTVGQHRILATRAAMDHAEQVVGAIAQRVGEFFKRDYQRTLQHFSAAVEETQSIAQHLQLKAQTLADQTQQKIGSGSPEPTQPTMPSANELKELPASHSCEERSSLNSPEPPPSDAHSG